jgi:hypothetical protein
MRRVRTGSTVLRVGLPPVSTLRAASPLRVRMSQRVLQLCALNEAHDDEQQDSPNGCNDDATYESAAKKLSEQEAAENRANDANHEIADEAKPSTFDEDASQPTRHHTNNEKPDKAHFESPVGGQGGHRMTSVAAARGAGKQEWAGKRPPIRTCRSRTDVKQTSLHSTRDLLLRRLPLLPARKQGRSIRAQYASMVVGCTATGATAVEASGEVDSQRASASSWSAAFAEKP